MQPSTSEFLDAAIAAYQETGPPGQATMPALTYLRILRIAKGQEDAADLYRAYQICRDVEAGKITIVW